ncbi:MAG TPA: rod shape-determining protein MreD [Pirellulales bacterium]|nr:rod shape-determining protein MreD [Pirellulales bacterium]
MSPYVLLALAAYLAAALDTALAPAWAIGRATPDLLALTAVLWLLAPGRPRPLWPAAALGLLADLLAPGRLGVGLACFAVAGYTIAGLRPRLAYAAPWLKAAVVAIAVAAIALGGGLLRRLLGELDVSGLAILGRSAAVGVYTAGVALPILMVFDWLPQPRWP